MSTGASTRLPSSYATFADLPSPSDYGPGEALAGGRSYWSDGKKWKASHKRGLYKAKSPAIKTTDLPAITSGIASSLVGRGFYWNAYKNDGSYGISNDFVAFSRGNVVPNLASALVEWKNISIPSPGSPASSTGYSFIHTGSVFEMQFAQNQGTYLIKIDGEFVGSFSSTSVGSTGGGNHFVKHVFGTYAKRRIEVIGTRLTLRGIKIGMQDSIEPAQYDGPRMIVLGDSWCANGLESWPTWLGEALGIDDTWSSGIGGSGLVATNGYSNYEQRLASDVIAYSPDIVVIQGSGNDPATSATVNALGRVINALKVALAGVQIIYVAPIGSPPQGKNTTRTTYLWQAPQIATKNACVAAAVAAGAFVVDLTNLPTINALKNYSATLFQAAAAGDKVIKTSTTFNQGDVLSLDGDKEWVEVTYSFQLAGGFYQTHIVNPLQLSYANGVSAEVKGRHIFNGDGFQGKERWVAGTIAAGSSSVAVPDSSVFEVGQAVYLGETIGGYNASTMADSAHVCAFIQSKPTGAAVVIATGFNMGNGQFSGIVTANAGGTLHLGIQSNSDVYLDNTLHPSLKGAMHIGYAVAEQAISYLNQSAA